MIRILFLDDMEARHAAVSKVLPDNAHVSVDYVWTAEQAIEALSKTDYTTVFLDHDLSEDDILMLPGGKSKVPTGMDVVHHILTMKVPPHNVVIHSMNGPAAEAMYWKLQGHPIRLNEPSLLGRSMTVTRVPFPSLIARLR